MNISLNPTVLTDLSLSAIQTLSASSVLTLRRMVAKRAPESSLPPTKSATNEVKLKRAIVKVESEIGIGIEISGQEALSILERAVACSDATALRKLDGLFLDLLFDPKRVPQESVVFPVPLTVDGKGVLDLATLLKGAPKSTIATAKIALVQLMAGLPTPAAENFTTPVSLLVGSDLTLAIPPKSAAPLINSLLSAMSEGQRDKTDRQLTLLLK